MPPKLLAGVFWIFMGGTILSLIFDGQSTSVAEGAGSLSDLALIRSFTFQLGSGDEGGGGLLGGIPLIGGFLDGILNINFSFEIPYPPLDVWGSLMRQVLLWDYEYLTGPLEYVRYLLLLISVGVVAALIDLGIKIMNVIAGLIPG